MKRQPSEWEKIIANEVTDKQLISKIYNQLQYFLPGEAHGQRSLADYSPQGCKESNMTEAT